MSVTVSNAEIYWSLEKNEPTEINQIKKKYFNNRNLKEPEGIWIQDNLGIVAIVKIITDKPNLLYKKILINSFQSPEQNGTKIGTLVKTKFKNQFTVFEKYDEGHKKVTATGRFDLSKKFATTNLIGTENKKNLNIIFHLKKIYP